MAVGIKHVELPHGMDFTKCVLKSQSQDKVHESMLCMCGLLVSTSGLGLFIVLWFWGSNQGGWHAAKHSSWDTSPAPLCMYVLVCIYIILVQASCILDRHYHTELYPSLYVHFSL